MPDRRDDLFESIRHFIAPALPRRLRAVHAETHPKQASIGVKHENCWIWPIHRLRKIRQRQHQTPSLQEKSYAGERSAETTIYPWSIKREELKNVLKSLRHNERLRTGYFQSVGNEEVS